MKKNTGLKVLSLSVVAVFVLVLSTHHSSSSTQEEQKDPNNLNAAIASQFNDNIRDVAARLQDTEKKLAALSAQNEALKKQAANPSPNNDNIEEELKRLKEEVATLKNNQQIASSTAYPIDAEAPKKEPSHFKDLDELLMKKESNATESAYWQHLTSKTAQENLPVEKEQKEAPKAIPYYTIPAGADLGHSTLLSALIGEVPVEGKLMQPLFPFAAIINRGDLMAANGVNLPPNIAGMKLNGYAIGIGSFLDNISCVRAYVTSALFVFDDGHFVTLGKEQMNSSSELMNNDSLGYLTTDRGNPCIHGQYFTNAPRVLATLMASDGIKGFGNALSQWQMSYSANANGMTGTPTGSMGNYALGGAVSQSTVKAADWLEKRIQGSFDMVYVPASISTPQGYQPLHFSFHVTQTLNLDKEINGRVLDYGHSQQTLHDFSLQ